MYCPNCGKEVMDDDVFCMNCGYRLQAAEEKAVEEPAEVPAENENAVVEDLIRETAVPVEKAAPEYEDPFLNEENMLKVPVKDVHGDGPSMICRMCGCKIPADSVYCPVCQQQTDYVPPRPQQPAQNYYYAPQYAPSQPQAEQKPKAKMNILALVGFILSIFCMTSSYYFTLAGVAGIVLGALGLKQSKQTGKGKGFAIAAIVVGAVAVALNILLIVLDIIGVTAGFEAWLLEFFSSTEGGETIYPFGDAFDNYSY